jgi:hypothetical protein
VNLRAAFIATAFLTLVALPAAAQQNAHSASFGVSLIAGSPPFARSGLREGDVDLDVRVQAVVHRTRCGGALELAALFGG